MSVNPEYYYNLSGNITDGKKEYSLHHKEDKIGGLSISSGLKENHIEYGTNSLLDLLNKLNNENKELKQFKDKVFEVIDNHILEETDLRKEFIENGSHYSANISRNIIDTLKLIKKELSK